MSAFGGLTKEKKPHPSDYAEQMQSYTDHFFIPDRPGELELICLNKAGDAKSYLHCGELKWNGKKWILNLRVGVFGVTGTREITDADIQLIQTVQKGRGEPNILKTEYVQQGKTAEGWEQVPEVAEMIRHQIKTISSMMSNHIIETQIDFFFVNEREVVPPEEWVKTDSISDVVNNFLRDQKLQKEKFGKTFYPIKYEAKPDIFIINPGAADPFTWPEYMAHEFFHLISMAHKNDGFLFGNYPITGLMNGGHQFNALRDAGLFPKIAAIEFNTLIVNQLAAREAARLELTGQIFSTNFRILSDKYSIDPLFVPNYFSEGGYVNGAIEDGTKLVSIWSIQSRFPPKSKEAKMDLDNEFTQYWTNLQVADLLDKQNSNCAGALGKSKTLNGRILKK